MCGICGQYNFGNPAPVRHADIKAMTDSLIHRGPDDEGQFIAGPLGFGFRRLSIIDLAGGHQPMSDHEESVWSYSTVKSITSSNFAANPNARPRFSNQL
jgi:asparagine synthase (glutamine-hydrolysing)